MSFGVFQDYYSNLPQFAGNSNIALIGTIATGLSYLGAPFSALLTKRCPRHHKHLIFGGWLVMIGGVVAGSFANTVGTLILTQGVMYGAGFIVLTYPILSMVDEWWVARKGMALGLIAASSGLSGAIMPFICSALLKKYGYQTTLRVVAIAMVILTAPLLPTLKGRLPPPETNTIAKIDWYFLKKPLFWVFAMSTLAQGLGFFFPTLYLPTYATALGLNSYQGALVLSMMSISQLLGQFGFGFLSDKNIPISMLSIVCSVAATVAAFCIWGLAKSLGILVLFAMVYGFFAYSFASFRAGISRVVSDDPSSVLAIYSILVFCQGIGNILAAPISSWLLRNPVDVDSYGILKFKTLVLFTGGSMAVSGLIILAWIVRPRKSLFT